MSTRGLVSAKCSNGRMDASKAKQEAPVGKPRAGIEMIECHNGSCALEMPQIIHNFDGLSMLFSAG